MPATPATEPTPFDDGALFDLLFERLDYGLDFYLALARAATGPVLDLCCGTGRALLPCLKAGVDVEGVDLSPALLDTLRTKARALGFQPRVYEASMTTFQLARRFALIMIPCNSFVHNLTTEDQIAALTRCHEHLSPGGLLAFDGFFPAPKIINAPDGTRELEGETTHPETGLPVRVFDTRTFNRVEQTLHSRTEIELLDASGKVVAVHPSQTTMRWIYKYEMTLLLRVAGFARWEIHGGFDRHPLQQETDGMVVEAWKEGVSPHDPEVQPRG